MTRSEYWILDLLIQWSYPLYDLEAPYLEIHANKSHHGLAHKELVELLHRMFQEDKLQAFRIVNGPDDDMHDEGTGFYFKPTTSEIEAGLAGEDKIFFSLTQQGGLDWEVVSKVDWNRYFHDADRSEKNGQIVTIEGEIICASYDIANRILQTKELPILSPEWDVLTPWNVTYWKALPSAHRVRYRHEYGRGRIKPRENVLDLDTVLEEIGEWYVNPWEEQQ